jgi:hypothetical protein
LKSRDPGGFITELRSILVSCSTSTLPCNPFILCRDLSSSFTIPSLLVSSLLRSLIYVYVGSWYQATSSQSAASNHCITNSATALGRKPALLFAYIVFGRGCLFCGLASTINALIAVCASRNWKRRHDDDTLYLPPPSPSKPAATYH